MYVTLVSGIAARAALHTGSAHVPRTHLVLVILILVVVVVLHPVRGLAREPRVRVGAHVLAERDAQLQVRVHLRAGRRSITT
jgi:hypothetical protein